MKVIELSLKEREMLKELLNGKIDRLRVVLKTEKEQENISYYNEDLKNTKELLTKICK